jgi:ribosomal protein L11 methyltransferase
MPWLQLETEAGLQHPEALESVLEDLGAVAVSFRDAGDEPILEPAPGETPRWSSTIVTALFPADMQATDLTQALDGHIDSGQLRFSVIGDRDWHAEWRSTLQPLQFGNRLWVVPDDMSAPGTDAAAIFVYLSPGMAFGTGEHPTTAMCLEWLDGQVLTDASVLDYGCGSGLLAIAALSLGAPHVSAVDIDPQALEATRSNAANNSCLDRLIVDFPEEISDGRKYDVLVANILSGTLVELGPAIRDLMAPGARLALSGILAHQANQVRSAWSDWATLEVVRQTDEWVLLAGQKHGIQD